MSHNIDEENMFTEVTEAVYDVVQTYVDIHDYANLKGTSQNLRTAAISFVDEVLKYEVLEEMLMKPVESAARKYRWSISPDDPTGKRQFAVALKNAVYDYVTNTDPDWDDDTIEEDIDDIITDLGIDVNALNNLVASIY